MNQIALFRLLTCLAALCLMSACVAPLPNRVLQANENIGPGEVAVFGQITADKSFWPNGDLCVFDVQHMEKMSDRVVAQPVAAGENFFCWRLPPGEYLVLNYLIGTGCVRIGATFKVAPRFTPVYVGELRLGIDRGGVTVATAERFEAACKMLTARFTRVQGTPITSLMQVEQFQ